MKTIVIEPILNIRENITLSEFIDSLLTYTNSGYVVSLEPSKYTYFFAFTIFLEPIKDGVKKTNVSKKRLSKFKFPRMENMNELGFMLKEISRVFYKSKLKKPSIVERLSEWDDKKEKWVMCNTSFASSRRYNYIHNDNEIHEIDYNQCSKIEKDLKNYYDNELYDNNKELRKLYKTVKSKKAEAENIISGAKDHAEWIKKHAEKEGFEKGSESKDLVKMINILGKHLYDYYGADWYRHSEKTFDFWNVTESIDKDVVGADNRYISSVKTIQMLVETINRLERGRKSKQRETKKRIIDSKGIDGIKTYLIKNKKGQYKIGKSKKPKVRERTLLSDDPDMKIVHIWDKNIESELHQRFKDQRIRGEWFNLTSVQVEYICTSA